MCSSDLIKGGPDVGLTEDLTSVVGDVLSGSTSLKGGLKGGGKFEARDISLLHAGPGAVSTFGSEARKNASEARKAATPPSPDLATSNQDQTRVNQGFARQAAARRAAAAAGIASTQRTKPLGVDQRASIGRTSVLGL